MKHTPGPYRLDDFDIFIFGPNSEVIAEMRGEGSHLPIHENGVLLAAAPDMLKALKLASKLIGIVTIGQAIEAGIDLAELGLNPWCVNEGLASRDDELATGWLDRAIRQAEGDL